MIARQHTPNAESIVLSDFNVAEPTLFQNEAHWA
jgi:hypothetical protein